MTIKERSEMLMKVKTAKNSFLVTRYFFSDLLRTLLTPKSFSWLSISCERAALISNCLASVYIYMKGFVKSKCVRIGANVNLSLS